MTHKDLIKEELIRCGPMCDDCLSSQTKIKPRQTVNRLCHAMVNDDLLNRSKDICPHCGSRKIINRFKGSSTIGSHDKSANNDQTSYRHDVEALPEDGIKRVLVDWLSKEGWKTIVAWGNAHGIDIEATRGSERWIIEVKGPGSRQPMRVNYFISILGEILQRMDDPHARYSIALPNLQQYRGLWERLPTLAKTRTKISIIFVSIDGKVELDGET